MNIGINAYEANVSNRVGSNEYAYRVLIELEKQAKDDDISVYLPSPPLADLPKERIGWKYIVISPQKFWTQWRLPVALFMRKIFGPSYQVFLSLGHYAPRFCPFPSVVCVMDLAYIKFPQFFKKSDVLKLTAWTSYSVRNAKHIIAISENTKRDIVKQYGKKSTEITVAYPGFVASKHQQFPQNILHKIGVKQPYFLYVGTIQPRKNIIRLLKAFELVHRHKGMEHIQLVIAGKEGWMTDEFTKAVQQSHARNSIRVLGFVTDEQKKALYQRSVTSILIGLYEGFGIPPLESMWSGTIPIVSNTASLPEVVGDAGVLVDPYSIEDIARGLLEVLQYTPEQRMEKLKLGFEQVKKFSWKQTGEQILNVLHKEGVES